MEINTKNEINGRMCYMCKKTFVQFRKITYYLNLSGEIIQDTPRVICRECYRKKKNREIETLYQWWGYKWNSL